MVCAKPGHVVPYRYFADFIEGRRGEILDAALAVFGEKGYEAGTMREIARSVGVTEPAIYRHYESKEAILADIVATAGDRISGEMRRGLAAVDRDNLVEMLHALIEMRRRGIDVKDTFAVDPDAMTDRSGPMHSGAGGVLHILFHAAPHKGAFIGLLRTHLGQPMVAGVRELIPRIDAQFGISRSAEEVDSLVRVFMSLFAGYFTTSLMFDTPPNDEAIVSAVLAIMGWDDVSESTT
jgi:AcrR family transcriptional regulator